MKYNNLKIIGTHHVMEQEEIEKILEENVFDIIGLELCKVRAATIDKSGQDDKLGPGDFFLYKNIVPQQDKQKLSFGLDQIIPYRYAVSNKIPLYLLDINIHYTEWLLSKINTKEMQSLSKEPLDDYNIKDILNNLCIDSARDALKEFPELYEILLVSREKYMAYYIEYIVKNNMNKNILCLLGKLHVESVKWYLEN